MDKKDLPTNQPKPVAFHQLCSDLFETIARASTKADKVAKFRNFVSNWRKYQPVGYSMYPVIRLFLPQLDRDRPAYGIKEHLLAKKYIKILVLPPDGNDALRLMNYRAPKAGSHAGDFAEVAFWVLKKQCGEGGKRSVEDVNRSLDEIAAMHTERNPTDVDKELTRLIQNMSAHEQKWLIRIILKEMKLGVGPKELLREFHKDANDFYDVTNSLSRLCAELHDPNVRLNEIEVKIFDPFRPMLSEELDITKFDACFMNCPYNFVETKLDGERFQIHMKDGSFRYFSRNAFEYTSNYGPNSLSGTLTPRLAKLLSPDVTSVILDGEMMCWNTKSNTFTSKGMEIDVKKLNDTHVNRPCFCPFDILYLNGEVLTGKELHSRLITLERIVTSEPGTLHMVERKKASSKEDVLAALNKAIDDCEEGVIMKLPLSVYKPNARKNGGWYKIKPEYYDGMMDTLDLLIIGGYHGYGRFGGTISQFLVAVKDNEKFLSTSKVGCGYSNAELKKLQTLLAPHWHPVSQARPSSIEWGKEKPEMWIEPCKSVILEVKASEIMPSSEFSTGHYLRFPRVVNIRQDKSWTDCCTMEEFDTKRKNASGKLTANKLTIADTELLPSKPKKKRSKITLAQQFQGIDSSTVNVVSNLLAGKTVCVMSGYLEHSKEDVEKRIVRFGGKLVQNPGLDTWCVLSEYENIRVKNVTSKAKHDVLKCSWLWPYLSRQTEALPDIPRVGYLSVSLLTESKFQMSCDPYGDHFTVPATIESLTESINIAEKMASSKPTMDDLGDLDFEVFGGIGKNPCSMFRRLSASSSDRLMGCQDFTDITLRLALSKFTLYGGQLDDETPTHVICQRNDAWIDAVKLKRAKSDRKFHIVSVDWIEKTIQCRTLLSEADFLF